MEPTEAQIAKAPAQRIDWRTGKPLPQRDDAFWQDHDSRRREAGLSVPQYCAEHGLALSTYRHRVYGRKRKAADSATAAHTPRSASFVELKLPAEARSAVEITLDGMTVRLQGAAERVLARVLARLG